MPSSNEPASLPQFEPLPFPVRIGIVSDTHLSNPARFIPDVVIDGLSGCDLIFHAGDVNRRWVLARLGDIAPVYAVRGNNDAPELQEELPEERYFDCGPHRLGLLHGWSSSAIRRMTAREWTVDRMRGVVDCAVYGHSHVPEIVRRDGLLLANPGSPTQPRWQPRATYAVMEVREQIHVRLIEL